MKAFRIAALAALLLSSGVPVAHAVGPMIDWDPAYTFENLATTFNSVPGEEFKMVGIISGFDTPLAFLNPIPPGREYTFYVHNLISLGTVTFGPPATQFYQTHYVGGTIEIYEDLTPESSFDPFPPNATVPANYIDGTLILSGSFTSFFTNSNNFTAAQAGNIEGDFAFTGGTLFPLVSQSGLPCPGLFTGGSTWKPSVMIPGYIFRHDGKIDLQCPTSSAPSTWGKIKTLYR